MSKPIVVIGDIEELIERDKPKSPIKNNKYEFLQHNCPVCMSVLDIPQLIQVNFCPKCGQRIDWNEK